MAKKDLEALATILEDKLKQSSEDYRRLVSDFEAHVVTIDVGDIRDQIRKELKHRSGGNLELPESIERIINEGVPVMCKKLYEAFDPAKFNTNRKQYIVGFRTGSPSSFTFQLAAKPGKKLNVFRYFRRAKQQAQRPLVIKLDNQIASLNAGRQESTQIARLREKNKKGKLIVSAFLDIGHTSDSSVSFQRQRALNQALFDFGSMNAKASRFIQEIATENELVIVKEGDPRPGVISELSVFLQGKGENRGEDLAKMQKALNDILDRENWPENEASDSPVTVAEKRILNELAETKGANFKKQKINNGDSTGNSKKRKGQGKVAPKFTPAAVRLGKAAREDRPAKPLLNLQNIMGIINQKLPQTVLKNMGDPALNNRTGRFAGSVRVTDVNVTPKGFPSIGYTYMKSPYQTYEMGYSKGDPEQDPRRLIDSSIREIALNFAIGRFYTRRV